MKCLLKLSQPLIVCRNGWPGVQDRPYRLRRLFPRGIIAAASLCLVLAMKTGWAIPFANLSFSPDGARFVTAVPGDNAARLWDDHTGKLIATLKGDASYVDGTALFSPDGTRIATGNIDSGTECTVHLWDGHTGTPIVTLRGHHTDTADALFSPAGTRIVTTGSDNSARLWDGRTGSPIPTLKGCVGSSGAASFFPDGTHLVTTSDDDTYRLWDGHTGKPLATLKGNTEGEEDVRDAFFAPDGIRIVTISAAYGNTSIARLWNGRSGKLIAKLKHFNDYIWAASFSPDGTRIVTVTTGGEIDLWDGSIGKLFAVCQEENSK